MTFKIKMLFLICSSFLLAGCHETTIEHRSASEIVYLPPKHSVQTTHYHVSDTNTTGHEVVREIKHYGPHRPQFHTQEIESHPNTVETLHYQNNHKKVIDKHRTHNLPGSEKSQPR